MLNHGQKPWNGFRCRDIHHPKAQELTPCYWADLTVHLSPVANRPDLSIFVWDCAATLVSFRRGLQKPPPHCSAAIETQRRIAEVYAFIGRVHACIFADLPNTNNFIYALKSVSTDGLLAVTSASECWGCPF
jgi:hypothetical protein